MVFIGQGRFTEVRAQKKARVASLDLSGLKLNIFNGTTMVGAVGKILKIMLSRLFQIAILES